jgi:hypothetical protein
LAWRNKFLINNYLTKKITDMFLMFDLTFLASFGSRVDGLFYCKNCSLVLGCKSKPGFISSYTTWDEGFGRFWLHPAVPGTETYTAASAFVSFHRWFYTFSLSICVCDLWMEDLNAQPKFCHVLIKNSTKNLCSPRGIVTESRFQHFMPFQCRFLNFEAQ